MAERSGARISESEYNEFHFVFNLPFLAQEDSLTEDLLQVQSKNKYLIHLG